MFLIVSFRELNYLVYRDTFREEFGIDYTPEDHGHTIGFNDDDFINIAQSRLNAKIDKKHFYRDIHGKTPYENCVLKKGARELLSYLHCENIKLALATNTSREKLDRKTKHLGILAMFDLIITSQDVQSKKPNPEIYLLTVTKLQLKPADCLVVEDSESGITAAIAAGCHCFYVPHKYTLNPKTIALKHSVRQFDNLLDIKDNLSDIAIISHKC